MKFNIFSVTRYTLPVDTMLLLIRVVAGISFAFYGSFKISHPFNWMGDDAVFPAFFQMLAAVSEFVGGIAWVIGFLTPVASFGILCTMAVANYVHIVMNGDPFVSFTGGSSYDSSLLFLVISLMLLVLGPGRFSLDRLLFGKK